MNNTVDNRITIIAAVAANGAIGFENRLLYRLPADMKRFKALTTGNTIIMGRRTYESLPHGALPNRRNIVLTRSNATFPGCEVYHDFEEALRRCSPNGRIFIIGGGSVYKETIPFTAHLCLTLVHDTPPTADTFFPDYSSGWIETSREDFPADNRHSVPYSFVDYARKDL